MKTPVKEERKNKLVYSVKEVSQLLGINVNKVYDYINGGLLPCVNIGHKVVLHDDLTAFLKKYKGCNISNPKDIKQA